MNTLKVLVINLIIICYAYKEPNWAPNKSVIVHLFEWTWKDIADECVHFLQFNGYAAVQVSPPNENIILPNRPWYERYQPVSYILKSRSGSEDEFTAMVQRCNAVGIRIYVDVVFNHMAAAKGNGTAGNPSDPETKTYKAVPYLNKDFHSTCSVDNYNDATNVRNCELVGLKDLNQGSEYVRNKIVTYLNYLIDLGVAGFRIDAAKHMWPADLETIYSRLKNLNTKHGFMENSKPFIYQEVIDYGGEAISINEYLFARVLEFRSGKYLSNLFRRQDKIKYLKNWGTAWGLVDGNDAVVFIDNHDTQRGDLNILNYKNGKIYKMAVAFMLAHPYGINAVMSSFAFDKFDQGPPHDKDDNILPPGKNYSGPCESGWVCEHRYRVIKNMVQFKNAVFGTGVNNWWSNGDHQIAFSRGNKGFIVFNNDIADLVAILNTSLPNGTYCDVISGNYNKGKCSGKIVNVDEGGRANITISTQDDYGVIAIFINSKQN